MSDLTPGQADQAIAALLAPETPERARVYVDLSTFSTNRLAVGFEECDPVPDIGDYVDAVDLPGHREATAEAVGRDDRQKLVRVAIDWTTIREMPA